MSESVAKKKKRSFGYKIKKFADIYKSTDEYLGEGSCGTVRTFYNVEKQKEFAVKIVENSSKRVRKKVLKEIEILHHCKGHENITQLQEFYEEDHKFYLVFEKMEGLTLLDWLERHRGVMREEEVAKVARGLATALHFLHSKGVAHRDLKLENVLCTTLDDIHPVRICDFDLSTDFGGGGVGGENALRVSEDGLRFGLESTNVAKTAGLERAENSPGYGSGGDVSPPMEHFNLSDLASAVGSADYMAPEVVRVWLNEPCHYSEQCDIWSLGVVLYILLCGYKPFGCARSELCCCPSMQPNFQCDYCKEEHFEQIKEGVVEMDGVLWASVSEGAKDLLLRMLVKDPAKRLTASQVLSHPWVVDASVFTHTKSHPIPCSPLNNSSRRSDSLKDYDHGSDLSPASDSFNNTLVEQSLCNTLIDRIFSIELDDCKPNADACGGADDDGGRNVEGGIDAGEAVTDPLTSSSCSSTCADFPDLPPDDTATDVPVLRSEAARTGKPLLVGSCDSGNVSGISLIGSPCILALNPGNLLANPHSNLQHEDLYNSHEKDQLNNDADCDFDEAYAKADRRSEEIASKHVEKEDLFESGCCLDTVAPVDVLESVAEDVPINGNYENVGVKNIEEFKREADLSPGNKKGTIYKKKNKKYFRNPNANNNLFKYHSNGNANKFDNKPGISSNNNITSCANFNFNNHGANPNRYQCANNYTNKNNFNRQNGYYSKNNHDNYNYNYNNRNFHKNYQFSNQIGNHQITPYIDTHFQYNNYHRAFGPKNAKHVNTIDVNQHNFHPNGNYHQQQNGFQPNKQKHNYNRCRQTGHFH